MPAAAAKILVAVEIAVREDVDAGPLLVAVTTASASWNFSRNRMSCMQVSSGFAHMLMSNQRGRGHEPVTVLGRIEIFRDGEGHMHLKRNDPANVP